MLGLAGMALTAAQPPATLSLVDAAMMGRADAPIVMIEYSDFHCPFCRKYTQEVLPQIKKDYVETGKLLYVFRHLPLDLHPTAPQAAVAAICATRQGKFWPLHDRFFSAPTPVPPDELESHARAVGVDLAPFRLCMKGLAREDVRDDQREAQRLGFAGTPGFALGANLGDDRMRLERRLAGAAPYQRFKSVIDALLGGQ
jgi:protein-disulfide isomerase